MRAILERAEKPLTRSDILRRWPESAVAPGKVTLWNWLNRAMDEA